MKPRHSSSEIARSRSRAGRTGTPAASHRTDPGTLLRYVVAGVGSNAWAYLAFTVLYLSRPEAAAVQIYLAAALVAMPVSFFLNRRWVFSSRAAMLPEFGRFTVVYAVAVVAGSLILAALLKILPTPVLFTQAVATAVLVIVSFLTHSLWTFGMGHRTDDHRHSE